jgi:hypothetical protein
VQGALSTYSASKIQALDALLTKFDAVEEAAQKAAGSDNPQDLLDAQQLYAALLPQLPSGTAVETAATDALEGEAGTSLYTRLVQIAQTSCK